MASTAVVQKIFKRGFVADAVQSLGVSTIINVADKKLGGKLTAAGVSIGQTLNGKPLTFNGTDVVMLMGVVGSPGNWMKKSGLMNAGVALAVKKIAEAFDYIDPPTTLNASDPRATNVTMARIQREQQSRGETRNLPPTQQYQTLPNIWGGN